MKHTLLALAAVAALGACQPSAAPPKAEPAPTLSPAQQSAELIKTLNAKGGDLKGVLTKADDAGYPMFWLTFTLDGGVTFETLANDQELPNTDAFTALVGKPVTATIQAIAEPDLLRLEARGRVVMEREIEVDTKLVIPPDAKTVTGVLSGAREPSGDLPNELTVTAKDGTKVAFRQFFDERLAAQEGREVTLTYEINNYTEVSAIALATAPTEPAKK